MLSTYGGKVIGSSRTYGGKLIGSSRFSLLPQLPLKIMLASKVVKNDSKIILSLC